MNARLAREILDANIAVHERESQLYDRLHREIFNSAEQRQLELDLDDALGALSRNDRPILDIGCGTGNVTLKLMRRGFHVLGVDLSQSMLDRLAHKARAAGLDAGLKVICANVDDFLVRDEERFAGATMSSVLHHLPHYLQSLQTVAQRVGPSGFVYITHEPLAHADGRRALDRVLEKVDALPQRVWVALNRIKLPDYSVADYHARQGLAVSDIASVLTRSGFRVVRTRRYRSAKLRVIRDVGRFAPNAFSILATRPSVGRGWLT